MLAMTHSGKADMKSRRKIHIGILYLGRKGGICHYTYELVRVISKMARVTCYLSSNNILLDAWHELPCTVKVFNTYKGFPSLIWSMIYRQGALKVAAAIDADAPNILLDTGAGPWAGIIKQKICCQTLLADVIHDVEFHPDRWAILSQLYELVYPVKADIFIGISEYSYKQLLLRFPDAKHIHSLHGAIHSATNIDFNKIASNRNRLLFFGRIEKYKGIEALVDAFRIAKRSNPQLSLDIVGYGPLDSKTKNEIDRLNIKLRNEWIHENELQQIFADSGVMVLPYLSATQSGVAMSAIANGLPAIATNVGALPEQIIHGKNGLIVPPGDANALANAMLTISKDYTLAYKMAEQAYSIAFTIYAWENIGSKLLKDLDALISKS
jgi:glycosyltransferase involved in cell wall biosynthesis